MELEENVYNEFYDILLKTVVDVEFPKYSKKKSPSIWDITKPGDLYPIGKMLFGREPRVFYRLKTDYKTLAVSKQNISDDLMIIALKYLGATLSSTFVEDWDITDAILARILFQFYLEFYWPYYIEDNPQFKIFKQYKGYEDISIIIPLENFQVELPENNPFIQMKEYVKNHGPAVVMNIIQSFYEFINDGNYGSAEKLCHKKRGELALEFYHTTSLSKPKLCQVSFEYETQLRYKAFCDIYYEEIVNTRYAESLSTVTGMTLSNIANFVEVITEINQIADKYNIPEIKNLRFKDVFQPNIHDALARLSGYNLDKLTKILPITGMRLMYRLKRIILLLGRDFCKIVSIEDLNDIEYINSNKIEVEYFAWPTDIFLNDY